MIKVHSKRLLSHLISCQNSKLPNIHKFITYDTDKEYIKTTTPNPPPFCPPDWATLLLVCLVSESMLLCSHGQTQPTSPTPQFSNTAPRFLLCVERAVCDGRSGVRQEQSGQAHYCEVVMYSASSAQSVCQ